jgi:hypothetical protein
VAANLQVLGGRQHEQARSALREIAEQRSIRLVR